MRLPPHYTNLSHAQVVAGPSDDDFVERKIFGILRMPNFMRNIAAHAQVVAGPSDDGFVERNATSTSLLFVYPPEGGGDGDEKLSRISLELGFLVQRHDRRTTDGFTNRSLTV